MVGLVLVSHSRQLAEALVLLLRQVAGADLRIAVAAGAGSDHRDFGTDASEISEAIRSVYSKEGVVVFMDLGSAILSAEMALDFLPGEFRDHIICCPGALVEGAVAAAVQAAAGASLEQVCREARQALEPKVSHLLQPAPETKVTIIPSGSALPEESFSAVATINNPQGLHARPAARFVQLAAKYSAVIRVINLRNGQGPASGRSLNALACLGVQRGDSISISATGSDSEKTVVALVELVEANFGLSDEQVSQVTPALGSSSLGHPSGGKIQGVPVADGICYGPLVLVQRQLAFLPERVPDEPEQEWRLLQEAIERTQAGIEQRRQESLARLGPVQAEIFTAHRFILEDPELIADLRTGIFTRGQPAVFAWQQAISRLIEAYRSLEDTYQQARAADVLDVSEQVLFALSGETGLAFPELDQPAIIFSPDITPSQITSLDLVKILGVVTANTSANSHSAILARALGIPLVSGIDLKVLGVQEGCPFALDGSAGVVWLAPDADTLARLSEARTHWLERRRDLLILCQEPAVTRDGRRIEVAANVGGLAEARSAIKNGAEGVGVLRTEFLYLSREFPPGEEEQLSALSQIAEALEGRRVIVRTLDVGGDKHLPYLDQSVEANPYLGVRGIRLSMQSSDAFHLQLRAILRAGARYPVSVMFPMVSTPEECIWIRGQLEKAHAALEKEDLPHRWPVEAGMMVEVPSAALLSASFAPLVDFLSIGTNDLTQYTLAAERGNAQLADLYDALHPAVLNLIKQVVEAAHRSGKWVGVCGEIAADLLAVPVLVGLGVDELSMNPAEIPAVKALIRDLDEKMARTLAGHALSLPDAKQVRKYLHKEKSDQ